MLVRTIRILALFFAVVAGFAPKGFAQTSEAGSGSIVTQTRDLKGFTSVVNNGSLYVRIVQGPEFSVRIESVKDFLPSIQTMINDSVLFIDVPETALRKLKKTEVLITLPELRSVRNAGAGKMELPGYNCSGLRVDNDGGGILIMDFTGDRLDCRNSGVGLMTLSGTVKEALYYNRGAGLIQAKELKAAKAYIENDGIGGVTIFCSGELSVVNRGLGRVRYSGEAELKSVTSQGLGSVKKIRD